jgi:hypothetical protein
MPFLTYKGELKKIELIKFASNFNAYVLQSVHLYELLMDHKFFLAI